MRTSLFMSSGMLLILLIIAPQFRAADGFFPTGAAIVPAVGALRDGNTVSRLPYLRIGDDGSPYRGPTRYQQVFGATDFGALPSEGAFLLGLAIRADCLHNNFGVVSSNATFRLSTALRGPDTLSPVFSENRGPDEMIVLSGSMVEFPRAFWKCADPPAARFNGGYPFQPPFFYRPSRGNLLLEVEHSGLAGEFPVTWREPLADAEETLGDSTSSQFALSLTNRSAEVVETRGLAVRFLFTPIPFIRATNETNHIVLTWPTRIPVKLQSTQILHPFPLWEPVTNKTQVFGGADVLVLPPSQLSRSQYFRLFWNSPQPGIDKLLPPSPGLAVESP